jgi:hypothetical protein
MVRLPYPPDNAPTGEAQFRRVLEQEITRLDETIRDVRVRPTVQDIAISFDDSGRAYIVIKCNEDTLSFRYVVSSEAAPVSDTVRLADVNASFEGAFNLAGPFSAGSVLYVSALAYAGPNGDGRESPLRISSATRGEQIYNECRIAVVASTDTTLTVEVSGASAAGQVAVQIVSIDGTAVIEDGLAVGVEGVSPQQYVLSRPIGTASEIRARASFPDALDDDDLLLVPEVGFAPLLFLASRGRLLELTATEMRIRYVTADPFPQGVDSVSVSTVLDGVPAIDPATPVLLDPDAVFSGQTGTYQDYVITRPAFGEADGEVRFTVASVAGARVPDTDAVRVPARASIPPWLDVLRTLDDDEAVITWDGGPTVLLDRGDGLGFITPPASPITVLRGAVSGGVDKIYTFRAEGHIDGEDTAVTQDILIPKMVAVPPGSPELEITLVFINASTDFDVTWTEANMPGGQTYTITYEITVGDGADGHEHLVDPADPSPSNIVHTVGSGAEGIVTVRAYDGVDLIAEDTFSGVFAT